MNKPAPTCPACKGENCYAKLKSNAWYCPNCWNLFGRIFIKQNDLAQTLPPNADVMAPLPIANSDKSTKQ